MNTLSSRAVARGGVAVLAVATIAAAAGPASAGGMVLHTRGVRPTARGGAFVAGADDLGSMWFNPAGLVRLNDGSGKNDWFLFDAAFVSQDVSYQRIDSGYKQWDPVKNSAPGIPVPSVAYAHRWSDRLVWSAGIWAPYAGLTKFPADGPERFSAIDLSESLLVVMAGGIGYKVSDRLRVGATVQNMVFSLASQVVFAGCPGETLCGPEDPDWDAMTKLTETAWFVPSASGGVQYDLHPNVTVGASLQLPYYVTGRGKVETRLPNSGFYSGAHIEGDRADVTFTLPAVLRAGIEARPGRWRIEGAVDVEFWGEHKDLFIDPKGVTIVRAPGVSYELGPNSVPRHYQSSIAGSIGIEGQPLPLLPLRVLAGYTYETAAAPTKYLSVLTVDGQKHAFSFGVGYQIGRYRIDAMGSYFKMADRTVDTCHPNDNQGADCKASSSAGEATQLTPLRDNAPEADQLKTYVNWGTYKSSWLAVGMGISASW
jgi:long-chain fatty acid transport protein